MIRIFFKDTSPLPFREWDIEDGKIICCEPDPEVSWVGVALQLDEATLFDAPLDIRIAWADGTFTSLPIDSVMRLPERGDGSGLTSKAKGATSGTQSHY